MSLRDRVVTYLESNPNKKARDIADALGADRSTVNSLMYKERGRTFQQLDGFRWRLARRGAGSASRTATDQVAEPRADTPLGRLSTYYLACLAKDLDRNVSEFAKSKFGEPNYAELAAFPPLLSDPTELWSSSDVARVIGRIQRERRKLSLVLGYPTRLSFVKAKSGWEGFFVEPVMIFELTVGGSGRVPELLDERPELNIRALRALTGQTGPELLDEAILLRQELGLDSESFSGDDYEEMIEALRQVRPEWPWREDLDPNALPDDPRLAGLEEEGLYNRAILLASERSPYTQGLETELRELGKLDTNRYEKTALGNWLGSPAQDVPSSNNQPLIEVLPLNSEQRDAVEKALISPLSVITGPPGTGKSQVVTSILVNCAWRGQCVLFASKNHKAVDVVETRVNSLGPRPVLLRLGTSEIQGRLAEYLASLLAATTLEHEKQEFEEVQSEHRKLLQLRDELMANLEKIVELRNSADEQEQEAEPFRQLFPDDTWRNCAEADLACIGSALQTAQLIVSRAIRAKQNPIIRLFWPAVRRGRIDAAIEACEALHAHAQGLGLSDPPEPTDPNDGKVLDGYVADAGKRLDGATVVQRYFRALNELSSATSPEAITHSFLGLERQLAEVCEDLWKLWLRLQPSRLSAEQRRLLGDYKALLETITQARETNEKLTGGVYARFYQLFPKLTTLLPAWAVTNLSARGRIPLQPGFFDLLIIDEASQCDIASVLPLLYRCKRAVIIGDPKQLRHITQIAAQVNQQLMQEHEVAKLGERWSYTANSLFDLGASLTATGDVVSLRDHHRSRSEIIEFSNEHFYEGRLRIATRESELRIPKGEPAVRWVHVTGSVRRPARGGAVNRSEALAVVGELERLLVRQGYTGSVGVVSPFRAQANLIRDLVNQNDRLLSALGRSELLIETVYRFQGDERDVMVFSPVVSRDTPRTALGFLRSNPNTFNVAITRARAALVVVGDHQACRQSGVDHLAAFARYVESSEAQRSPSDQPIQDMGPEYPAVSRPDHVSDWERLLYRALHRAGVWSMPQYAVEHYALDLAVFAEDRRLDVEVDGERYHRSWNGELALRDQLRNRRLIELGWDVMRFWVYQVRDDLDSCVKRVVEWQERTIAAAADQASAQTEVPEWRVRLVAQEGDVS